MIFRESARESVFNQFGIARRVWNDEGKNCIVPYAHVPTSRPGDVQGWCWFEEMIKITVPGKGRGSGRRQAVLL